MECTRVLKPTDINYKIICAGSKFDVGQGRHVNVSYRGLRYQGKMHNDIKGRIEGLSKLFADFKLEVGEELLLSYNEATNTILILDAEIPIEDDESDTGFSDIGSETAKEKEYTQSEIYDIFLKMDNIVQHQEYYSPCSPLSVATNHEWIVYGGGNWGDAYWLMNENTLEKIPLKVSGHRYDAFLGANPAGLWFMKYNAKTKQGDGTPGTLIYTSPFFDSETVWRFNGKKAAISTPYIYRMQAFYIAYISENKQSLMAVKGDKDEEELFVAHKGESIHDLSVNDGYIVFRLESDNDAEKSGWYVLKRGSYAPPLFLNRNRKAGSPWLPAIEIHKIFLDKKVMWTGVTENEAAKLGISRNSWICRSLGEPKEGSFWIYKNTGKPVVWNMGNIYANPNYFDGNVLYLASSYYHLERMQRDGSKITLYAGGHGECDKLVVSDKYLYVNYDAYMPVRVPRLFRQPENTGAPASSNPEAEAIWGEEDIRF